MRISQAKQQHKYAFNNYVSVNGLYNCTLNYKQRSNIFKKVNRHYVKHHTINPNNICLMTIIKTTSDNNNNCYHQFMLIGAF